MSPPLAKKADLPPEKTGLLKAPLGKKNTLPVTPGGAPKSSSPGRKILSPLKNYQYVWWQLLTSSMPKSPFLATTDFDILIIVSEMAIPSFGATSCLQHKK